MYDFFFICQVQNGYKLPEWTKKVFPFTLRPLATNYLIRAYGGSKELIQLGAGIIELFSSMSSYFINIVWTLNNVLNVIN